MFSNAARRENSHRAFFRPGGCCFDISPDTKGSAKIECHDTKKELTLAPSELTWKAAGVASVISYREKKQSITGANIAHVHKRSR
jgi:hypothetical protein